MPSTFPHAVGVTTPLPKRVKSPLCWYHYHAKSNPTQPHEKKTKTKKHGLSRIIPQRNGPVLSGHLRPALGRILQEGPVQCRGLDKRCSLDSRVDSRRHPRMVGHLQARARSSSHHVKEKFCPFWPHVHVPYIVFARPGR